MTAICKCVLFTCVLYKIKLFVISSPLEEILPGECEWNAQTRIEATSLYLETLSSRASKDFQGQRDPSNLCSPHHGGWEDVGGDTPQLFCLPITGGWIWKPDKTNTHRHAQKQSQAFKAAAARRKESSHWCGHTASYMPTLKMRLHLYLQPQGDASEDALPLLWSIPMRIGSRTIKR